MLQFSPSDTILWREKYGNFSANDFIQTGTSSQANERSPFSGVMNELTGNATNPTGFVVGDIVLIHQTREGGDGAGHWQLNKIRGIAGNVFTFKYPLQNNFSGYAQIIRIIQNRDIQINGTYAIPAWDGATGGIGVFMGKSLSGAGTIDANTKGYRGATVNPAGNHGNQGEGNIGLGSVTYYNNGSGGGGGVLTPEGHGSSGVGGANGADSTNGPRHNEFSPDSLPVSILAVAAGQADLQIAVPGGGGGSGARDSGGGGSNPSSGVGGTGGGIVFVFCEDIDLSGFTAVRANGGQGGYQDTNHNGGGGGGAGGSIVLKGKHVNLGTGKVTATGGAGNWGCNAQHSNLGTDGSIGRIRVESAKPLVGTASPTVSSIEDKVFNSLRSASALLMMLQ